MSATSAVLRGRRLAESLMLDTCTVSTLGAPVTDADGNVTVPETVVYGPTITPLPGKRAGMCKVQAPNAQQQNPEAGGATFTVQRYEVHVPVGSLVPAAGQVVTVTASVLDANLVGRKLRVVGLLHKSMATAYRLAVEAVS